MVDYNIHVDDAVAESIRRIARTRKVSEEECAAQILTSQHEEIVRFPQEVFREGRKKIADILGQIPSIHSIDFHGIDFRYWKVRFQINEASPVAERVIRRLGYLLNTQSAEMMLPTVFKPIPDELPNEPMRWEIASTAARLDPATVENWLRINLPQPLWDEKEWLKDD